MRLMIVEDDEPIGRAIVGILRQQGYAVDWEQDGAQAAEVLAYQAYDAIVIDIGLPGTDGISILRDLRRRGIATPVLMLTARTGIDDRVNALDFGADDYLAKPFDPREFLARCRALLRRHDGQGSDRIEIGEVVFDGTGKTLTVGDVRMILPNREFRLLEILLRRRGQFLSKDQIAEHLFDFTDEVGPNAIEVYVGRLRRKLGDALHIRTVRGLGYTIEASGDANV